MFVFLRADDSDVLHRQRFGAGCCARRGDYARMRRLQDCGNGRWAGCVRGKTVRSNCGEAREEDRSGSRAEIGAAVSGHPLFRTRRRIPLYKRSRRKLLGLGDLPTTYTSLSLNGKTKKIKAYAGVPEELEKLERTIFEVTGSRQWAAIDAEGVREEVRRGWNVRSPEATSLLIVASFEGDAETVKALIDAGANVNANDGYEMPIQMARGAAVVRLLVAAGADVNGQVVDRNSDPALQNAARWGDAVTVRELLKNNAHIDGRAWDGSTALMRAAEAGRPEVVSTLLEAGASVRGTNQFGYDVMKCLDNGLTSQSNFVWGKKREEVEARFEKVREMLMKAGATI